MLRHFNSLGSFYAQAQPPPSSVDVPSLSSSQAQVSTETSLASHVSLSETSYVSAASSLRTTTSGSALNDSAFEQDGDRNRERVGHAGGETESEGDSDRGRRTGSEKERDSNGEMANLSMNREGNGGLLHSLSSNPNGSINYNSKDSVNSSNYNGASYGGNGSFR